MASTYATTLFKDLEDALRITPPDSSISGRYMIVVGRDVRVLLDLTSEGGPVAAVRFLGHTESAPAGLPCIRYRDDGVLADIFERRMRPDVAWASGAISITGDMAAAGKLRRVFEVLRRHRASRATSSAGAPQTSGAQAMATHSSPTRIVRSAAESDLGLSPASAATDIEDVAAVSGASKAAVNAAHGPLAVIDRSRWQPDGAGCSRCGTRFSLARRRHHCRFCGACVCSTCSSTRLSGERACDGCASEATRAGEDRHGVASASLGSAARSPEGRHSRGDGRVATGDLEAARRVPPSLQQQRPEHLDHTGGGHGTPDRKDSWLGLDRMLPGSASAPVSRSGSMAGVHSGGAAGTFLSAAAEGGGNARVVAAAGDAAADAGALATGSTRPVSAQSTSGLLRQSSAASVSAAPAPASSMTPRPAALYRDAHVGHHDAQLQTAALVQEHEREVLHLRASVESLESQVRALSESTADAGADALEARFRWMILAMAAAHALVWSQLLRVASPYGSTSAINLLLTGVSFAIYPLLDWASAYRISRFCRAIFTAGVILLGLRNLRRRTADMSDADSDPLWDAAHAVYARFAYRQMLSLKAFWLKLAQYVGARSDVFPPAYVRELSKLSDATEPTPFAEVRAVIEQELRKAAAASRAGGAASGAAPVRLEDVFERFDEKPLASASIAQVHKARLRVPIAVPVPLSKRASLGPDPESVAASSAPSGAGGSDVMLVRDVVCKVQHAGVAPIMLSDLTALKAIVRFVACAEPEFDFRPVISEWAAEAVKELDFRREAAITAHVGRAVAAAGVRARVPAVVDIRALLSSSAAAASSPVGLTQADQALPAGFPQQFAFATPRLLVAEFVDGLRVTDVASLDAARVDKQALASDVCEAFAVAMHVDGVFSGDPHSGNLVS